MSLREFLLDQLAKDDQRARHALGHIPRLNQGSDLGALELQAWEIGERFSHQFRPERMLVEIQAKRRIIDEHGSASEIQGRVCKRCSDWDESGRLVRPEPAPCRTLRLLSLPYADHRDYQSEWHPHQPVFRPGDLG